MLVARTLPLADDLAVAVGEKLASKITDVPEAGVTDGQDAESELNVGASSVPVTTPIVVKMG